MSLDGIIANTNKEIAGSRTKNRLTVQISYAIQLIMDFYPTDFLIMMDYIEDVAVISDPTQPSAIHLYQVKTKSSDKQYMLSAVIRDKWFQKLYANAQKYEHYLGSASIVCNTDIVTSLTQSKT
ncbi:MAG: dsDNA nuclease domain-containing protein [[Clostridium] symbiosum]